MTGYLVRRLLGLIPVLFGVSLLVFAILKFIPGDPARAVAGLDASREDVENIRRQLGLDQPVYIQYVVFLGNALTGDFGRSVRSRRPVIDEVANTLPATVQLALVSMAFAIVVGVVLGIVAATRQYTIWDGLTMVVALLGISVPIFWLGLMLILLFAVQLGWLPAQGRGGPENLVLPSLTLGAASAGIIARMMRSSMLEVMRQDYVRTARAKGLGEQVVVLRHALKNAAIPAVTVIGLQFGYLLGGAIITETVFAWPGMGRLVVEAIKFRDYPVVQACILLLALAFSLVNILVDLTYAYLDPRIRYS
ncbi:MAG: ABC transporter permease [Chloroflexota bacterium]|nr:ABC transporter permease [Chloroflexota bacterium]